MSTRLLRAAVACVLLELAVGCALLQLGAATVPLVLALVAVCALPPRREP